MNEFLTQAAIELEKLNNEAKRKDGYMKDNKKSIYNFNYYVNLYKNPEGKMYREISNWDLTFGKDKDDFSKYLLNYVNIIIPYRAKKSQKNDKRNSYTNNLQPKRLRRPAKNDRGDSFINMLKLKRLHAKPDKNYKGDSYNKR